MNGSATVPNENARKLQKRKKAKSEVGKLLRTVSSLRPMEELAVSTESLRSFLKVSYHDGDSDGESEGTYLRPTSRGSAHGDSTLNGSLCSDWTEATGASRLTQRELISDISLRAKKNRPPPDYILPLEELDPSKVSWNRRVKMHKHQSCPAINIIGCMHPVELILAKADQRSRKRELAVKVKQVRCEEKVKEINASLEWKFTRAERYAADLERKQRQYNWIRFLKTAEYIKRVHENYHKKKSAIEQFVRISKFARMITVAFHRWYRRHIFKKVQFKYFHAFDKCEKTFRLYLRIYRKRRAVERIRKFFGDYRGHHKMNLVVHKYLSAVKTVQKLIRDFLSCKACKLIAVSRLWEKFEIQFIKKQLELKKKRSQDMQLAKKSNEQQMSEFGNKPYFTDIKQQAVLWSRIDNKMSNVVSHLRASGVIVEEDENEVIAKLMIPFEQRMKAVRLIVERTRKDFYAGQRTIVRKKVEMDAVSEFSVPF
jgi:hypothetical protein